MANETTRLSPAEEAAFQQWARQNRIPDVDAPESRYDYRGFWRASKGVPHPPGTEEHFPDTFKQHGHPTFSQESQYSRGAWDGGKWIGETFLAQPPLAVSHAMPPSTLGPTQDALRILALHLPKAPAALTPASPPATPATATADDIVLRSLLRGMGQGGVDHPVHDTTVNALLEALTRGRP